MKSLETYPVRSPEAFAEKATEKMTPVERFSPYGLKVLVVDDDPVCLMILETMLRQCNYTITTCHSAVKALALLRENRSAFDLVMSDVHMPDMDGFELLEAIGLELDLPVIMMSANGQTEVVMKGITHGACDYLIKPVRIEELRNIWQHVMRRRGRGESTRDDQFGDWDETSIGFDSPSEGDSSAKKRKAKQEPVDEPLEDLNGLKKARVVWSVELHQQFVNAVHQLSIDKAVPKRILEIMNVQGLSRENVASHLQKYRQYLKRLSGVDTQPYPVASFQAAQAGNFAGSMQIHPGGRGVAAASGAKVLNVPLSGSSMRGLSRGPAQIDEATQSMLAQLHAHQYQQGQGGILPSSMLAGVDQFNVGLRPGLASPPPNPAVAGLQRMSSLELDMLMKAAQQDALSRYQSISSDEMFGLGKGHNNLAPLPIGVGSFKQEDELDSLPGYGQGMSHVFGAEKLDAEMGPPFPYPTLSNRGLSESINSSGFRDYGPSDNPFTTSPSELSISLLTQVFPDQSGDECRSGH